MKVSVWHNPLTRKLVAKGLLKIYRLGYIGMLGRDKSYVPDEALPPRKNWLNGSVKWPKGLSM